MENIPEHICNVFSIPKLSKEFNLNAALSANITYKILPSPNFEISNVLPE